VDVESKIPVKILQVDQEERKVRIHANPDAQKDAEDASSEDAMQSAIALGVKAVKGLAEVRAARIEEVRALIETGAYRQDSVDIARKMLESGGDERLEIEERN